MKASPIFIGCPKCGGRLRIDKTDYAKTLNNEKDATSITKHYVFCPACKKKAQKEKEQKKEA